MGISLAWVAVKGLDADAILARLDLAPTGRSCDILETGITAHSLPGGGHMVASLDCAHRIIEADPAFDAIPFQELKDLRARPRAAWWKRLWA